MRQRGQRIGSPLVDWMCGVLVVLVVVLVVVLIARCFGRCLARLLDTLGLA